MSEELIKDPQKPEVEKENNKKDNEESFNRLFNLQLLIQKHDGLKELCM